MKKIIRDSDQELVISISSPVIAWIGGMGIFFLACMAYLLLTHQDFSDERIGGLIGAAVTFELIFLAFHEKAQFTFDLRSRCLTWSRLRHFVARSGTVPFNNIDTVVVQSCMGGDDDVPSHRVALLTRDGEVPLTIAYDTDRMNGVIAERIKTILADSPNSLFDRFP